jgi:hypothetical protein
MIMSSKKFSLKSTIIENQQIFSREFGTMGVL